MKQREITGRTVRRFVDRLKMKQPPSRELDFLRLPKPELIETGPENWADLRGAKP